MPVPLRKPGAWDIRCGDAGDLGHVPAGSVDLVLTDPPYFNYIAYSELGHFYVPWLVRLGWSIAPTSPASPRAARLEQGQRRRRGLLHRSLALRLQEVVRVCRPGARMVFTYQNLDGRGWEALADALALAGIRPVQGWPMFGDGGAGLHKHANSISWDCVLHCELDLGPIARAATPEDAGDGFSRDWQARLAEHGHA